MSFKITAENWLRRCERKVVREGEEEQNGNMPHFKWQNLKEPESNSHFDNSLDNSPGAAPR